MSVIETDRIVLFGNVIGVYCNEYVNTLYVRMQSYFVSQQLLPWNFKRLQYLST